MYSIRYDTGTHVLHLKLWGFWTPATLVAFVADLRARTARLLAVRSDYGVLSDSSAFAVQSPEVSAGFERIMAEGTARHQGPVAIVVASHLNKLQAERTLRRDRLRVFLTEADARAWLATAMA